MEAGGRRLAIPGPAPAGVPLWSHLLETHAALFNPRAVCPPPQAPNKALASILGKSNLRFAGMSIAVSISIDGLNLSVPATRQVSAARPTLGLLQPRPWPPLAPPSASSSSAHSFLQPRPQAQPAPSRAWLRVCGFTQVKPGGKVGAAHSTCKCG